MINYTVRLFGIFEDKLGQNAMKIELDSSATLAQLKDLMEQKNPVFSEVKHYMVAVNQMYCDEPDILLKESDEIAFIPPIAGG